MKTKIPLLALVVICALSCDTIKSGLLKRNANGSASMIRALRYDNGNTIFNSFYDATKRSTVIVANSKNFSVLAENNPDAIMNKAFDLVANFTQDTKLTADAKLSIVRNALQLNKHSSSELFAANALYRLNEMYNNTLNVDSARLETKNENKENQISIRSVGYKSQLLTANNYVSIFDSILSKTVQLSKSEAEIAKQIKLENISDNIDELKSLMLKQESNLKKMSKKNDSLFLLNKKKLDSLGKKNNERLEKLEKPKS